MLWSTCERQFKEVARWQHVYLSMIIKKLIGLVRIDNLIESSLGWWKRRWRRRGEHVQVNNNRLVLSVSVLLSYFSWQPIFFLLIRSLFWYVAPPHSIFLLPSNCLVFDWSSFKVLPLFVDFYLYVPEIYNVPCTLFVIESKIQFRSYLYRINRPEIILFPNPVFVKLKILEGFVILKFFEWSKFFAILLSSITISYFGWLEDIGFTLWSR